MPNLKVEKNPEFDIYKAENLGPYYKRTHGWL